jgi:hypothetical protein
MERDQLPLPTAQGFARGEVDYDSLVTKMVTHFLPFSYYAFLGPPQRRCL